MRVFVETKQYSLFTSLLALQGQETWSLNCHIMARGRPHGRSKSDHRVCQAARYTRAAEYRERISISAEQQEARIAAVNAECDVQDAPQKRRCQKSSGLKKEAWTARGSAQRGYCKASGSGKKKANQRLGTALGKAAERGEFLVHVFSVECFDLSSRGKAEAGTRCAATLASIRKVKGGPAGCSKKSVFSVMCPQASFAPGTICFFPSAY
jgi:hypothetical protein